MAEPSIKDIAYRTAAGVIGGPVDLTTMVMRPFGYKTPDTEVIGGSEWIGKKLEEAGVISSARAPLTEFLASVAVPSPSGLAKGAAMAAPAIGGIFIGKGAKTWDALAAAKAKELERAGLDAKSIWQQTGTWKGPDGKWRQEISDDKSFYRGSKAAGSSYAEDVHLHPELYKAYPATGASRVTESPHQGGSFNPVSRQITVGSKDASSTMIHEQQHQIQGLEGFAEGGSPSSMILTLKDLANQKRQKAQEMFRLSSANDPLDPLRIVKPGARKKGLELEKEARDLDSKALAAYHSEQAKFDLYQRLAGEAEARAVQQRMNLTPAQRRATFPEESYDVPMNELIIRGVE